MMGLALRASGVPVKKPTGFMGNNPDILAAVQVKCDGDHQHEQVKGRDVNGPRSRQAQEYPSGLVHRVLAAYSKSCRLKPHDLHHVHDLDIIQLDQRINVSYYTAEEYHAIFPAEEAEDSGEPNLYGSGSNEFSELAKQQLQGDDWKFWTRIDLQATNFQISRGDGPCMNVVEHRFTFDKVAKQLTQHDEMIHVEDGKETAELTQPNIDIVTVFAWRKYRELAGARQVSLQRLVQRAHDGLGHPSKER